MTDKVHIFVEGNKAVSVIVHGTGADTTPIVVKPGKLCTKEIYGDQTILIQETGDFIK